MKRLWILGPKSVNMDLVEAFLTEKGESIAYAAVYRQSGWSERIITEKPNRFIIPSEALTFGFHFDPMPETQLIFIGCELDKPVS